MPSKVFELDDGLVVTVNKRRSSRHLRLSITTDGKASVSIPAWAPYKAGVDFARSRQAWIKSHVPPIVLLTNRQAIGKAHHLVFMPKPDGIKVETRVLKKDIIVRFPATLQSTDEEVQQAAHKACVRALRLQAQQLLPQRLARLANEHGFEYKSVNIKQLKRRWGSCDHQKHIVLNLFLMQLPWELIDYVLLHELTHTKMLRHGSDFWLAMAKEMPDSKQQRRRLREFQPLLG